MRLIVQPDDGVAPLVQAIGGAKKTLEIAIFRCESTEIEEALVRAVQRGVTVRALIAYTNRGGETRLRGLEMRLLAAGAVVARTNNDLARYHGKYFIVDEKKLYVLGFNFSRDDLRLTRSFGIAITDAKLVREACKLFEADSSRQVYLGGSKSLLVSPLNARDDLARFLSATKKELLIYDPEISDPAMLGILHKLVDQGVDIRVIGNVKAKEHALSVRASHPLRLHVRSIVRDRKALFVGSQSLRRIELDLRREVGVILRDETTAARIARIFDQDWGSAKVEAVPAEKLARKVAKVIAGEMGPVTPVLEQVAARNGARIEVNSEGIEQVVREAVKTAVRNAIHEAVTQPPPDK